MKKTEVFTIEGKGKKTTFICGKCKAVLNIEFHSNLPEIQKHNRDYR